MKEDKQVLAKYLPEWSVDRVYESISKHRLQFRISRTRNSKLGDFRPGMNGRPHRISVNHDLNPYHFLIVFVHELAHLVVFERYGNRVQAHGAEWKRTFRELMSPYFGPDLFPEDIRKELKDYLQNARAANGAHLGLTRVLENYDKKASLGEPLESLPDGSYFSIPSGRVFQKIERVRKRYKCLCMNNKRLYLFNPLAKVLPLQNGED